jgi:hypothetical protein
MVFGFDFVFGLGICSPSPGGRGPEGLADRKGVPRGDVREAHQGMHQVQLPRMIELQTRDAFAVREDGGLAEVPTAELHPQTAEPLGCSTQDYRLSSLRYDLSKLRAKGLVEKLPHSRRYPLLPEGYSICLVFLKLFERIYAPLTAELLEPFSPDNKLQQQRLSQLDKLYQRVVQALDDLVHALDDLVHAVGLKAA